MPDAFRDVARKTKHVSGRWARFVLSAACGLLMLVIIAVEKTAAENEKKNVDRPAPSKLELLKTFASEFVAITPGKGKFPKSFQMGSADGPASEQPLHQVTFGSNFAIAKYEVPQSLYEAVMGVNPSRYKGNRNSVEMMTWDDSNRFCRKVTRLMRDAKLIKPADEIRLPTEAEWEYCCRAGTKTRYSFGDSATQPGDKDKQASILSAYGWHTGNAAGNDPAVGERKPNPWGLYDVHGYLSEFVADDWHENYKQAPADGSRWKSRQKNGRRVVRGGSWRDQYKELRSAARSSEMLIRRSKKTAITSDFKSDAVGFRCVKAVVGKQP